MTDVPVEPVPRTTERSLAASATGLWLAVAIGAVVVGLDQLVKAAVTAWLGPDALTHRWELAGRFIALEYVENPGAAFGILRGQTGVLILGAVVAVMSLVVGLTSRAATSRLVTVGLGLVLGGALGNLTDRIRLGYVVDFVAIGLWPKFNLADCAITVGLALLGWYSLKAPDRAESSSQPSA